MTLLAASIIVLLLALSTLVSEDLTCVTAGELIRRGQVGPVVGIVGCFVGIYLGDLALWGLGRAIGPRVLSWPWVTRRISAQRVHQLGTWFDRHAPLAVLSARFTPGLRLPVYLGAGLLQRKSGRFAMWTFVAAAIWTPMVVILVALLGERFIAPFHHFTGSGWLALVVVILCGIGSIRIAGSLASVEERARIVARISRVWRWEFWPTWLFYLPLLPWIAWLSLRHRSFLTITAANPGIPLGGFVGESKFQIVSSVEHPCIIETILIPPADIDARLATLSASALAFPIIVKPDVGQRGAGVKLVRSLDQARDYLASTPQAVIAQPFHSGPYEAGIFYVRMPGDVCGRIFSITDKVFPELVGDGASTIEQLVWQHPRFRMQAGTFLARHAQDRQRVLASGERFRLAVAGNHCQGTLFRDGSLLLTPQLVRAIDEIAQSFRDRGFYFGRFDVRYRDVDRFKAGEDLTVIELNGVTSESTNLYDPSWSLMRAYRLLFEQWKILFAIGAANRASGHRPARARELLGAIVAHWREPGPSSLSD